jgi:hypothetical protein
MINLFKKIWVDLIWNKFSFFLYIWHHLKYYFIHKWKGHPNRILKTIKLEKKKTRKGNLLTLKLLSLTYITSNNKDLRIQFWTNTKFSRSQSTDTKMQQRMWVNYRISRLTLRKVLQQKKNPLKLKNLRQQRGIH